MVCALGVILPIAFTGGIAARKPVPVARSVPAELEDKTSEFGTVVWTKMDLWPGQHIVTTLRRAAAGAVALQLMFRDVLKPDVLVYWVAGNKTPGDALPGNAQFLGALSNGSPMPIPAEGRGETGRFVLYSLADHEVVAVSNPVTF